MGSRFMTAVQQQMRPLCWLGARAKHGMALPDASPTAAQMYCPRGVYLDDDVLVVSDSGNHRLLVWVLEDGRLPSDHSDADFVIGQPDFFSEGPGELHLPTGVTVADGLLIVGDSWHHRILGYADFMTGSAHPELLLGQSSLADGSINRGQSDPDASTLYWPYGLGFVGGRLYVADTGNRRTVI